MLVRPKFNPYTAPKDIYEIEIEPGVYLSGFNPIDYFDRAVNAYFETPDNIYSYGVCDNWENLKENLPKTIASRNYYSVFLFPVHKSHQPSDGGWRWHKWGEYIGKHHPTREYLYDEPEIDVVYCYSILQIPSSMVDSNKT